MSVHPDIRGQLVGVCFRLPSLGSGHRTQVIWLGNKRLYPLSHLVGPFNVGFEFIFLLVIRDYFS